MRVRLLASIALLVPTALAVSTSVAIPPNGAPGRDPGQPPATTATSHPPPPTTCTAPVRSDTQLLTMTSLSTPPMSDFWCGNQYRKTGRLDKNQADDFTTPCMGRATKGGNRVLAAQTKAEVRGWIRSDPGRATNNVGEGELLFALEPDIGWLPTATDVFAVNTMERVAAVVTPIGENADGRIHVELAMWASARPCTASDGPTALTNYANSHPPCAAFFSLRPPEHCFTYPEQPNVYWPFDRDHPPHVSSEQDGALNVGDYVRVVGTLWEDQNHGSTDCFAKGHSSGRGWAELHPVDFIARIPKPTDHTESGIRFLGTCQDSGSAVNKTASIDIPPRTARPGTNFQLRVQEVVQGDFTDFLSLATWSASSSQRTWVAGSTGKANVTVVSASDRRGVFRGVYRTFWDACTPNCTNRCTGAPDGCGGACTNACGTGLTCSSGFCCPAGQKRCGDACAATCTQPACTPCSCGGSSCEGTTLCDKVCRSQGK